MKVPNAQFAVVEHGKVAGYLLNSVHPDNGGKAAFFHTLGFHRGNWSRLAGTLRELAETGVVARSVESAHGNKYIVDGRIETPSGKSPMVRSVWVVDSELEASRLVTAYPHEERGQG